MTYWLINVPFLLAAAMVLGAAIATRRAPALIPWLSAAAVMVVLTAVFDNAIIGFGIVDYDKSLTSGVKVGLAPLEDFAYTLAALLAIPALWHLLEKRPAKATR